MASHPLLLRFVNAEVFIFLQTGIFATTTILLPQFLQERICQNKFNATVCSSLQIAKYGVQEDIVQKEAAKWLTILPMSSLLFALVMVLFVGPFADMIGKRRAMVICPLLTLAQGIIFLVLSQLSGKFNPAWLIAAMFIPGLFGDNQGANLLGFAYKADTTITKERTNGICRSEGFISLSYAVFGLVSGLLLKFRGFLAAFSLHVSLSLLSIFYTTCVIPDETSMFLRVSELEEDTTPLVKKGSAVSEDDQSSSIDTKKQEEEDKSKFTFRSLIQLKNIRQILCNDSHRCIIFLCILLLFKVEIPISGENYVGILYYNHSPFGLTEEKLGYLISLSFALRALGVTLVSHLLQRYFRFGDIHLLVLGFTSLTIYYSILGSAISVPMVYANQIFTITMVFPMPTCRSMLTKRVRDDLHGSVLALAEFADCLSSLIASFGSNWIYHATVTIHTGIIMYVYAFITFTGLITTTILSCKLRSLRQQESEQQAKQELTISK